MKAAYFVALSALLGLSSATMMVPPAGRCSGDGGYSCPARDEVNYVVSEGYDPRQVDWNALVADVIQVGEREPRFCNFAIRSWFHDVAGIADERRRRNFKFDGAADGSFLTDFNETNREDAALWGFGQFSRHVLLQIASAHGASHADVLTVAAAKCTSTVLAGTVDIAKHCESVGYPLYVGKKDWKTNPKYTETHFRWKSGNAPSSHDRFSRFTEFFIKDLNRLVSDRRWKLTIEDALALMGSHALIGSHGCTTNAPNPRGASIGDRTCGGAGGRQRMFTWNNAFFKDMTAGACKQGRNNGDDKNEGNRGRNMSPQDYASWTECGFRSKEGFKLGESLECNAMAAAEKNSANWYRAKKFGALNVGWQNNVWYDDGVVPKNPISQREPCCGFQCSSCEHDAHKKFWCQGHMVEERNARNWLWPYTYMDCDFNKVYNYGQTYCDGEGQNSRGMRIHCGDCRSRCVKEWGQRFGHPVQELRNIIDDSVRIMDKFRSDSAGWEKSYATAFCKLSNFGATYTRQKVSIQKLFRQPSTPCLHVNRVLSLKHCGTCSQPNFRSSFRGTSPLAPLTIKPPKPTRACGAAGQACCGTKERRARSTEDPCMDTRLGSCCEGKCYSKKCPGNGPCGASGRPVCTGRGQAPCNPPFQPREGYCVFIFEKPRPAPPAPSPRPIAKCGGPGQVCCGREDRLAAKSENPCMRTRLGSCCDGKCYEKKCPGNGPCGASGRPQCTARGVPPCMGPFKPREGYCIYDP